MSGVQRQRRFRRWVKRRDLLLFSLILGIFAIALVGGSLIDFVRSAIAKDEKVQVVTLKSELAQFLLATTQEDGKSILENPKDFAPALREMRAVELHRAFFTYFLTTTNGKSISASNLTWEPPRACAVDFIDEISRSPAKSLRACFAVVPGDSSGRFIYFAFRYPTSAIVRHVPNAPLDRASSMIINLRGDTSISLRIVFEQPKYAASRFPAQLQRFTGIHELTAYHVERAANPVRGVQGQAYERRFDSQDGSSANYVTIAGRIDSGLIFNTSDSAHAWGSGRFRDMTADARLFEAEPDGGNAKLHIQIPEAAKGTALQSIEQAYLTHVQSRGLLEIWPKGAAQRGSAIWTSAELTEKRVAPGLFQRISNRWAEFLIHQFEIKTSNAESSMAIQGNSGAFAKLTSEPVLLSDLATRAFFGLSAALVSMILLVLLWLVALNRLRKIASLAVEVALSPQTRSDFSGYAKRRDQVGFIGRSLNVLVRRILWRNAKILSDAARAERRRIERARLQDEQVEARHDVLRAIGHEIKTPLQALINRTDASSEIRPEIEKMRRAVDALYEATSVELGMKERRVVPKAGDLSNFMSRLSENYSIPEAPVQFIGEQHGVTAHFDPIALDIVLSGIIDNARTHRSPGTAIEVRLIHSEDSAVIRVHNKGKPIPESDLPQVFDLHFTTKTDPSNNMGLGLFSARIYVLGMRGSLKVTNDLDGVTFSVQLPRMPTA